MTESLESTAYHEAGHAVVMSVLGCPFSSVTITADEEALGFVTGGLPDEMAKYEDGISVEDGVRNALVFFYAGQAAVNRKTGLRCRIDGTDREKAISIASKCIDSSLDAEALLEECGNRAKALIDDHWPQVEAVAKGLLAQGTLTGEEVDRVIGRVGGNT